MNTLTSQDKAELFQQLAVMENAGLPLADAIKTLRPHKKHALDKVLIVLFNNLKIGKPLATAGISAGILSDTDSLLIQSATDSGKLGETFKRLATHYDLESKARQTIKSRMVFPLFIFILAVMLAPIPRLIHDELTIIQYLDITLFWLIKMALIVYVVFKLPYWLRKGCLKNLGMARPVDSLTIKLPIFNQYYIKHQITKGLETLGMLLEAGIPAFEAMPKAIESIDNLVLQSSFNPVVTHLKSHGNMTDSLSLNPYLERDAILFIKAGEASGKLDESLNHYGQIARSEVTSTIEEFAKWLPRILYGVICLYIAYAILNSQLFNLISIQV